MPNIKGAGILFVKDLSKEIKPIEPLRGNLSIQKIDINQDLYNLKINEELKERVKAMLSADKEGFIGLINNEAVHVSFVDCNHPLGAMFFGAFTLPDFRGRHIGSATKTEIFNYLKRKGIKKAYISCAKDNLSSYRSILRAGFKEMNLLEMIIYKLKVRMKRRN